MLHKPISTNHSPAQSHPRTQCGKSCSISRRYIWFQSIFQLLKVDVNPENILPVLKTSPDGLTIKTRSVVPLSNFALVQVQYCCRLPKFSIDVSMRKLAIHSQSVDIPRRNPDIVPRRTSLYRIMPLIQYQLINRSKGYTMASVQDKLQCCLLLPRTQQQQQNTKTNTHTRSKTKTDEAPSGSTQKQKADCFS